MMFEIKKLKIARSLSEETLAFTCDLWANGEHIGHASNHGHGGNTNVTIPRTMQASVETYAMGYLDKLPPRTYGDGIEIGYRHSADSLLVKEGKKKIGDWMGDPVEDLVDHLVNAADEAREAEKTEKKLAKLDAKAADHYRKKGLSTLRVTRDTGRTITTQWFPFDTDEKAAAAEAMLKMAHKQYPNATFAWKVVS